ncbi:MAG: hypothetical protein ACLQG3_17185 [Terracidiphilus sp.]
MLLVVYGVLILGYGIFEWTTGYNSGVQLAVLHTPVWWGALLTALGLVYVVKFRPGRASK